MKVLYNNIINTNHLWLYMNTYTLYTRIHTSEVIPQNIVFDTVFDACIKNLKVTINTIASQSLNKENVGKSCNNILR